MKKFKFKKINFRPILTKKPKIQTNCEQKTTILTNKLNNEK